MGRNDRPTVMTWALCTEGGTGCHSGNDCPMPRRPAPLPPSLPHAVFTVAEARQAGVSMDRLRARDLRRLGYGLYARGDVDLLERDLLTALARNTPGVVARGLSAARYWEFPLPHAAQIWRTEPSLEPVHLAARAIPRRSTGLLKWSRQQLRDEEVVRIGDLEITSRVRTWLDLAHELTLDELVMIGDHLVREPRGWAEDRTRPYATTDQLASAVDSYLSPGRPRLRDALELVRVGSDSPAETALRLAIGRAGLPAPLLNALLHENGRGLGEPDLSWPEWRLCVEHDGPSHLTRDQQEKDIARRERREAAGWLEVQTVARDLHDGCRRGVQRIEAALTRRGWRRQESAAA